MALAEVRDEVHERGMPVEGVAAAADVDVALALGGARLGTSNTAVGNASDDFRGFIAGDYDLRPGAGQGRAGDACSEPGGEQQGGAKVAIKRHRFMVESPSEGRERLKSSTATSAR